MAEQILYSVLTRDDIIKEGDEHVFISPSEWTHVKSSIGCKAGWIQNWVYRRKVLDQNTHRFMTPGEWTGADDEYTSDGGLTWEPAVVGWQVTTQTCERYRRRKNRLYRTLKAGETVCWGDEVSFDGARRWESVGGFGDRVIAKDAAQKGIFYRRPVCTADQADPIKPVTFIGPLTLTATSQVTGRALSGKYRKLGRNEKIQARDEFRKVGDDTWQVKLQDGNCGMLVKQWPLLEWRRPFSKGDYRYIRGGIRIRKGDECRCRLADKKFGPWVPVRFSFGQRVSSWKDWQFRRPV